MKKEWKWIWCEQNQVTDYNQTVLFKKEFKLKQTGEASLCITADSWYRVSINGRWVHDGPGRAYPNHFQYDTHEVGGLLRAGKNKIEVIVRYFGIGTFHQIPQQAGLLAQLDTAEGAVATDASWQASPSFAWKQWTPKISLQMEPVEEYDARRENVLDWRSAVEGKRSRKVTPRMVGLLTKKPRRPKALCSATVIQRRKPRFVVPVAQLAYPGMMGLNGTPPRPVILTSVLTVSRKRQFHFRLGDNNADFANPDAEQWWIAVNGRILKSGKITLPPGCHQVLFICSAFTALRKELAFPWLHMVDGRWGEWRVVVLDEFLFHDTDLHWLDFPNNQVENLRTDYFHKVEELVKGCKTPKETELLLRNYCRHLPVEQIFMGDFCAEFSARKPVIAGEDLFDGKTIKPSSRGDVELCFDFGRQTCGYFDFLLKADDGVVVDFNAIEYIRDDGVLQHVYPSNRNGMRYVTKAGVNRFTSLKRRSGRYLFVTLRNQRTPVEIRGLRLIESTAPVEAKGSFTCSDPTLNRIWDMSERTLQLCMEDTFTDCPLYEQTLWIGDARNEALYAYIVYGNYDVSARSLELGAQSLERYPIVGSHVPSSWDNLIPAWSFLWGMHVWEHYFYSGDLRLLRKLWPAVLKNIEGALGMLNSNGLFSGKFWNLIEWAPIDEVQSTVLHNNMLLAGALRAAEKCAVVLNEDKMRKRMAAARKKLVSTINKTWNDKKQSFPDSIWENEEPSPKTCQHTSVFSAMLGMIPQGKEKAVRRNLLNPPEDMTRICSPFVMQFLYEALEVLGEPDAILESIRTGFQPMVDSGSDTVWETFAGSTTSKSGFPTRSHCHAWASSPVWFLNRIVLGIRQTTPGGSSFEISPWLGGLKHASGASASPKGLLCVNWRVVGSALKVFITVPEGVRVVFKGNASHVGLNVDVARRQCGPRNEDALFRERQSRVFPSNDTCVPVLEHASASWQTLQNIGAEEGNP